MIGFIIGTIIAALVIGLFLASYVKCPPDMVYLISGLKKEPRVVTGKATFLSCRNFKIRESA